MSSMGSSCTPSGTPASPPATKGHSIFQSKPRRTENTASSWPVSEPNTASAAARRGSSAQAQNDIDTMPNVKPDKPCTNPATAAPSDQPPAIHESFSPWRAAPARPPCPARLDRYSRDGAAAPFGLLMPP